jgi:hypothetical protein
MREKREVSETGLGLEQHSELHLERLTAINLEIFPRALP